MSPRKLVLALVLFAAACGSSDKNRPLSRLEAAGDRCPNGGVVVLTGNDDDGDGNLDMSEIDDEDLICGNDTLTRLDVIPPGAICPNGGTAIKAGVDDDDNGQLDDVEVDTTQNFCKGTLVRSTVLGLEEAACYGRGGVKLEFGIDDDSDDVLDVSEVDSTTVTCNSIALATPPAGPEGTSIIKADGGSSGVTGGGGGHLRVNFGGSGGGSLGLFRTGTVNTDFTLPTRTMVPGSLTYTVSADTNIAHTATPPAVENTPYTNGTSMFVTNATAPAADDPIVTSLVVNAGVTATFNTEVLVFSADVVVNGRITRAGDVKALTWTCLAFIGGPDGLVDTAAVTAAAAGGNFTLTAPAGFINQADITTTGAQGATAGASGQITLNTGSFYNRGTFTTRGANATGASTAGGGGGDINISAQAQRFANSGDFVTFGGDGTLTGGTGGDLFIDNRAGDFTNSGLWDTHGGVSAMACTGVCTGGVGGTIMVINRGGGLYKAGDILTRGGQGRDTGCGGSGGVVRICMGTDNSECFLSPAEIVGPNQGQIRFSGNVDLSGGPGGANTTCGAKAGNFWVAVTPVFPVGQEVLFLGYQKISLVGGGSSGNSAGTAGFGGSLTFFRDDSMGNGTTLGGIVNYLEIDTSGGVGTALANGGPAGRIYFRYRQNGNYVSGVGSNQVVNRGKLTSNGAQGAIGGVAYGGDQPGYAGYGATVLYGPEGVDSSGEISTRGGFGMPSNGGYGGEVILSAELGPVTNTGAITSTGGTGITGGGYAGRVCMEGSSVVNSGALTAVGGNTTSGNSGAGASIVLTSYATSSANTGVLSNVAGTGGTAGANGVIGIDNSATRCFREYTTNN